MISRAVDALIAALATIAAVIGLTTLTENASWLGRAVWICLAVAAAGLVMRQLTSVRLLVLLGQLVITTWVLVVMFAADRLWFGLPGPDAWERIGQLVTECVAVMQRYAAPIPATEGVQLVFVAGGGSRRRGVAAARGVPHCGGQRWLVAVAVVLRHRSGDVARARCPAGPRPGAAMVDHRRKPADPHLRG
jgi:hypothetical protein